MVFFTPTLQSALKEMNHNYTIIDITFFHCVQTLSRPPKPKAAPFSCLQACELKGVVANAKKTKKQNKKEVTASAR